MSEERKPIYALVVNGEWDALDDDLECVMRGAKQWVMERINNLYRHALPCKVTPEVVRDMDTYIYKLAGENRVELPIQEWFDEYYAESKQHSIDVEQQEWKRYLELHEKFKNRPIE